MRWLFLIPLVTGVFSGYASCYWMDEISYLTGAFSLICLLIGLFLAPWELQLGVLVIVLIAVRLLWKKLNLPKVTDLSGEEGEKEVFSQRTYRGIPYRAEETLKTPVNDHPKKGTYRGLPWENEPKVVVATHNTQFVRKYRGIPINNLEENSQN